MSVTTGDVVAQLFTTTNPTTGAAADADAPPTGVLWVDGVADAAAVTIADAAGTGKYTFSVTMPTLTVAKRVQVIVDATIAGLACAGVVWEDQASPAANVTAWAGSATTTNEVNAMTWLFSMIDEAFGAYYYNDTALARIRPTIGLASANLDAQLAAVAKTGADGDTLETLSDQLDAMPAAAPSAADIKTALEADGSKLDHLWEMTENDGGVRRLTANALEAILPSVAKPGDPMTIAHRQTP